MAPGSNWDVSDSLLWPFRDRLSCRCRQSGGDAFERTKPPFASTVHQPPHRANCVRSFGFSVSMATNGRTGMRIECPFGLCSRDEGCPHAVQVALTTDRYGAPSRDGGAITSRDVIAAREAATEAARGLRMRRGNGGSPPPRRSAVEEATPGARTQLRAEEF